MSYFCFKSKGYFRPLEDWWGILTCDPEIVRYYCWLSKRSAIDIEAGSRHGPHISVIKGERPTNKNLWYKLKGKPITFEYSNQIRHNGYHAWLDVRCPDLSKLRETLGLSSKPHHSFHFTIGRLKSGIDHLAHEPRPKNVKKKLRPTNLESKY